jgi:hypothetical protein
MQGQICHSGSTSCQLVEPNSNKQAQISIDGKDRDVESINSRGDGFVTSHQAE